MFGYKIHEIILIGLMITALCVIVFYCAQWGYELTWGRIDNSWKK